MHLILRIPSNFLAERRYVLRELLADVQGVDWVEEIDSYHPSEIRDSDGRRVVLVDGLFSGAPADPWSRCPRPAQPVARVAIHNLELEKATGHPDLPVLFGNTEIPPIRFVSSQEIEISADLLGGAFWMLARVEELNEEHTDAHGRFPPSRMWLTESGLLLRPLVDEYRSILNSCLSRLWPGIRIQAPAFQLTLSHDMDHPTSASLGLSGFTRQLGKDVFQRKAPLVAFRRLCSGLGFPGSERLDPGAGLSYLLKVAKALSLRASFYWMVPEGAVPLDGGYSLASGPAFRMLQRTLEAGHLVGIHPGYASFKNLDLLGRQVEMFRSILHRLGKPEIPLLGRQHYLRWRPETWSSYCHAGISRDASLGFSDRVGFRSGTGRSYQAFDLHRRATLPLIVEPLHVMNNYVQSQECHGLYPETENDINIMRNAVRRFGGNFSILWHNNALSTLMEKHLFLNELDGIRRK